MSLFDSDTQVGVVYDSEGVIRRTSRGDVVLMIDDTFLGSSGITGMDVDIEDDRSIYRNRRRHGCGTYRYGKTTGKVRG